MTTIQIRAAEAQDAKPLTKLINALDLEEGGSGTAYDEEKVLACGFGPNCVITFLVADDGGHLVGFAAHAPFFDIASASPARILHDLYVIPEKRHLGLGRRMMEATAAVVDERGEASLCWLVYDTNTKARDFYARMGADDSGFRFLRLDRTAIRRHVGAAAP